MQQIGTFFSGKFCGQHWAVSLTSFAQNAQPSRANKTAYPWLGARLGIRAGPGLGEAGDVAGIGGEASFGPRHL